MFWDDEKLVNFIKTEFTWYYPKWAEIEPFIKKLDTSRCGLVRSGTGTRKLGRDDGGRGPLPRPLTRRETRP